MIHRGSEKALKLKQIYSQFGMEINNILLTEGPPEETGMRFKCIHIQNNNIEIYYK